ncbi:hypothetical protein HR45_03715 [Shewanella mangrovi]|uniref:VOC family protein n=1 Tax=Shewanella mangrovi TaxID=1515746 RepID=A0A094LTL1_9GAMM|nr:VOC family protein [Shewanella mangrovi]KFZ38543.1 hypothetical protein HR45_03715 [Shewanella mangrovi]
MLSYASLENTLDEFAAKISLLIAELGLQSLTQCDHVALRVNTTAAADALRDAFSARGSVISDNIINGRPILIIKLHTPLQLGEYSVACVELPYPKTEYPQQGWEHIELVLASNATDCEQLQQQLISLSPKLAAVFAGDSEIKVKASSPAGEAERLPNPTIAFTKAGVCVKVHPHTIEAIIASEQAS